MAREIGDQGRVLLLHESGTYASVSGTGQWLGLVTGHTINEEMGIIPLRYLGTTDRNVDQFIDGPKDYTGTLTFHPQDWGMTFFALGSIVDAGSPSPYTHVASELNGGASSAFTSGTLNPFPSFQIEDSHTVVGTGLNFVRTAVGCNVNTLSISAAQGEPVSVEVGYVAQNVNFSSGAATAVTEDTVRPFMWKDFQLHIPSGTVYEAVKSVNINVNNNLSPPHYLNGSEVIAPPVPGNRDYEVSVTLDAASERTKTLWDNYFKGGSTFNMIASFIASTGSRTAAFTFSGCKLIDMDSPTVREGVNEQTITIRPENCVVSANSLNQFWAPW